MTKIEGMALNVVLQLAKAELMSAYRTHNVEVKSVGFDTKHTEYDNEGERTLMVWAHIEPEEECFADDRGTHPWQMTWDEKACEFYELWRDDQETHKV